LKICYSIADQTFEHSKSIGILNVSLGLLAALARQPGVEKLVVLANSSLPAIPDETGKISRVNCELPLRGKLSRMLWDQLVLYRAAHRSGCDWIFLPKGYASFVRRPPLKMAAYVHDAMQEFYRDHYPGSFSRGEGWYFRECLRATLRRSARIFTNSDFTRGEVLRLAKALGITPPPVDTAGIGFAGSKSGGAKQNQIMVIISRWPHKLTRQAVDFVARWQREVSYSGLIQWVGDLPEGVYLPEAPKSRHSRRVPEAEYLSMMAESRALVYFSEYEGFGMPPVESILQGTAPVYSSIPAMSESALGLGFPFVNGNYESFSSAMSQALQCPQNQLSIWAESLLKHHHWEGVASRIVHVLQNTREEASTLT